MSAGQRWNLAAELTATAADLQKQVSSRSGKNLTDPAMASAIERVKAAMVEVGAAVALLTTTVDDDDEAGDGAGS